MSSGKEFALKRFLVFEESKVAKVIQEIRLMKEVEGTDGLCEVCYGCQRGPLAGEESEKEFLLLMELYSGGDLAQLLGKTGESLSPSNVCVW